MEFAYILFPVILLVHNSRASTREDELELRRDLFSNYSTKVRPVFNQSETIEVQIKYCLQSIFELNERQQTLRTSGFLSIQWRDETLVWDPEGYGGLTDILVSPRDMWLPDIIVVNGISGFIETGTTDFLVAVNYTGAADWTPGSVYNTHCPIDVSLYPFDTQTCAIVVSTWMYSKEKLQVRIQNIPLNKEFFWENGEWEYIDTTTTSDFAVYNANLYSFSKIVLKLKRRRSYYVMNVVVPVLVLSLLNVLVFRVPPESGEKMALSVTVLVAYTVLLSVISDSMPGTSNSVSYLAVYLIIVLVMGVISTFISALVLWMYHNKGRPPESSNHGKGADDDVGGSKSYVNTTRSLMLCPAPNRRTRELFGKPTSLDTDDDIKQKYLRLVNRIDKVSFWAFLGITMLGFALLLAFLQA